MKGIPGLSLGDPHVNWNPEQGEFSVNILENRIEIPGTETIDSIQSKFNEISRKVSGAVTSWQDIPGDIVGDFSLPDVNIPNISIPDVEAPDSGMGVIPDDSIPDTGTEPVNDTEPDSPTDHPNVGEEPFDTPATTHPNVGEDETDNVVVNPNPEPEPDPGLDDPTSTSPNTGDEWQDVTNPDSGSDSGSSLPDQITEGAQDIINRYY